MPIPAHWQQTAEDELVYDVDGGTQHEDSLTITVEVRPLELEASGIALDEYLMRRGLDMTQHYGVMDISVHGIPAYLYSQEQHGPALSAARLAALGSRGNPQLR